MFAEGDSSCELVYELYDRFRTSDIWLGILGSSGVGKEIVAKALHYNGHRRAKGFVDVNTPQWDSSLVATVESGGIEKGTYTGQRQEAQSVFEAADGGTCFWDEIFLVDKVTLGKQLRPLSELYERGQTTRIGLGNVKDRIYRANIRMVVAGDLSKREDHFDAHVESRLLMARINLPNWCALSRESRVILIRWMMVNTLHKLNLSVGQMSTALFRFMVSDQPATLADQNMRGLRNLWRALGDLQTNGVFNLSCLRGQLSGSDLAFAESLISDGSDAKYLDSLRLGENTEFERRLTALDRVVIKIAKCGAKGGKHTPCVSKEDYQAALDELMSRRDQPFWHDHFCEALYLMFAASSLHLTAPGAASTKESTATVRANKKDLLATAPRPLLQHFQDGGAVESMFKSIVERPLGLLTKRTANDHKMALRFQEFIEQPDVVARLLQSVERIACAYPSYLHHVPYWAHWAERHGGHSGNVSGQAVFQEKDGETLQISEEEDYDNE